jgi:hypothetical protein
MRTPDEVFTDIEADRAVREREIRLIDNSSKKAPAEDERQMLRRTCILLTYAHLEGFCRFAFLTYVAALNSLKLECGAVTFELAAAGLTKLLAALRNPSSKHPIFSHPLPDDAKLHLTAREAEFVEKLNAVMKLPMEIPEEAIDLESNLKAIVLKKNLFKLGLNYPKIDEQKKNIDKLLGIRNRIAHGDRLELPSEKEVDEYVALAFQTIKFVQYEIFDAMRQKTYLRVAA